MTNSRMVQVVIYDAPTAGKSGSGLRLRLRSS